MTPAPKKVVEAILLLADEPVPAGLMGEVMEVGAAEVEAILEQLAAEYEREDRGFVLRQAAGGWRLYTSPDCVQWLERFVLSGRSGRLTGAALEVLAIVAYNQPISRARIAEIRGVDSDGVVKTLLARNLIAPSGREPGPGAAVTFEVSGDFLERMGVGSVDELPPLAGFMPETDLVEEMEERLSPGI